MPAHAVAAFLCVSREICKPFRHQLLLSVWGSLCVCVCVCEWLGNTQASHTHGAESIAHLPNLLISFIVVQSARDETLVQIAAAQAARAHLPGVEAEAEVALEEELKLEQELE